jgi:7-carboxy-7-deazaguanine synthase
MSFRTVANPLSVEDAVFHIESFNLSLHHSVSFTGGEPLLQVDYLRDAARQLRRKDIRLYLETNGTLPDQLRKCLDLIDIIAMDWKLPSSTGGVDLWQQHEAFVRVGRKRDLFIKVVVTEATPMEEFRAACHRISGVSSEIPVVIQPVTPIGTVKTPTRQRLLDFQGAAQAYLKDIYVLPQVHNLMKLP